MKKTLTTLLIIFISCISIQTFANDCNIVKNNENNLITRYTALNEYHKFLPIDSFTTIVKNLKAYCCSQNLIECSEEEIANLSETKYPESPYLFDHLIDITMRRLDGISTLTY
jgi:hypothetical protein